jgi:hypothetical protein
VYLLRARVASHRKSGVTRDKRRLGRNSQPGNTEQGCCYKLYEGIVFAQPCHESVHAPKSAMVLIGSGRGADLSIVIGRMKTTTRQREASLPVFVIVISYIPACT